MSYKIVKNSAGDVIAFGPNDEHYVPTIKEGEILTIETGKAAEDLIKAYQTKQLSNLNALATEKALLLDRLGITADEARLLLS
jgi:hypothetical protein